MDALIPFDREPDPNQIDPRPCAKCGMKMAEHTSVDYGDGPEFFCEPPPSGPEGYDLPSDGERDVTDQHQAQPPEPLALITPADWRGKPLEPMRWLAENRIPAGDVTILSGDGGGGKTTVALQLAVAVECNLGDWLGCVCETGHVIFVSAEEPEDEMRRRLHRVARKRDLEPAEIKNLHFHFADPDACLLGTAPRNGPIQPTPLLASLAAAAIDMRPALIVVDSIAATFGGNQNDRVHARTFVGMFRSIARLSGCAILLLDHPSLSGITSGTGRGGSMDWQNATRARLHIETTTDDNGATSRTLEVKKLNYGPIGEKVRLQWEDGCFVPEGTASAPHKAASHANADQLYLDCLDAATAQGRNVFPMPGRGFAPKVFAEMEQAKGASWRVLGQAQERLFAAGKIANVPFGKPSKGQKRVERI